MGTYDVDDEEQAVRATSVGDDHHDKADGVEKAALDKELDHRYET